MSRPTVLRAEPGSSIIRIERVFDAPREKVFQAFTDPAKVARWWSPSGTSRVESFDLKVGGAWRIADVMGSDQEIIFFGLFHEVTFPERIVQTSEFANLPERGHAVLDRYEFHSRGPRQTELVLTEAFLSVEDRDMAIESGMEFGVVQQHKNLDVLFQNQEDGE